MENMISITCQLNHFGFMLIFRKIAKANYTAFYVFILNVFYWVKWPRIYLNLLFNRNFSFFYFFFIFSFNLCRRWKIMFLPLSANIIENSKYQNTNPHSNHLVNIFINLSFFIHFFHFVVFLLNIGF